MNTVETNWMSEFENCNLCSWECGVNRLNGELGVCQMGLPEVASCILHPAPPQSYTVFLAGCNFKCLNCQNWAIACYPCTKAKTRGIIDPRHLAREAGKALQTREAKLMSADRMFFSGGSPGISLPYVEEVVRKAREISDSEVKVNFDTNGYLTSESMERVLNFTNSVTFDIKAFNDETHRALTGASVKSVLENAKRMIVAKDKLWEFRYLLIPRINQDEVKPLARFLAGLDPEVPLNFLAFRPHFVMNKHRGPRVSELEKAVKNAKEVGLKNVSWSGLPASMGTIPEERNESYSIKGAQIAGEYAQKAGCLTHPRNCGSCKLRSDCSVKSYAEPP